MACECCALEYSVSLHFSVYLARCYYEISEILYGEFYKQSNAYANSGYRALLRVREGLGTRLGSP